jgi:CBS domain-containing protein
MNLSLKGVELPMVVRNVMIPNEASIDADATIAQAATKMRDRKLAWLHVLNSKKPVGLVSDRDIVTRAVAGGLNPTSTRVRDVMSADVYYCYEQDDVTDVAMLIGKKKNHWVLVLGENGRPVGIVPLGEVGP